MMRSYGEKELAPQDIFPEIFKRPIKIWQEGEILVALSEASYIYYFITSDTLVKVTKSYNTGEMFVSLFMASQFTNNDTRKVMERKDFKVDGRFFRKARREEIAKKIAEEI